MKQSFFLLFLCLFAVGCSTYSLKECQTMNWEDAGRRSAMEGDLPTEKLQHFQNTCEKDHGIRADEALFSQGYQQGLQILCSPNGGRVLGMSGKRYKGTCPEKTEGDFLKSFSSGRLGYLERRVSELERENADLKSEVSNQEMEVSRLRSELSGLQSRSCP